jgi:hypothetical protein
VAHAIGLLGAYLHSRLAAGLGVVHPGATDLPTEIVADVRPVAILATLQVAASLTGRPYRQ